MMPPNRNTLPAVLLNPPAKLLGKRNAILSGSGTQYYVPDFEGSFSLKSVLGGSATWEAAGRRFEIHENTYLVLNDRQHYRMTIDSARKVATFCVFFERGFVEDVFRSKTSSSSALLDDPVPAVRQRVDFIERIEPLQGSVRRELQRLKNRLAAGTLSSEESTADLYRVAESLLAEHRQTGYLASRLPAVRRSTREELLRRVLRGRDFLLSRLTDSVSLKDAARIACLSPFHFHRAFQAAFCETPHRHAVRNRLDLAGRLLRGTNRSVTEISLETGFESLGSFSALFHRTYGVSPRDYRRNGN